MAINKVTFSIEYVPVILLHCKMLGKTCCFLYTPLLYVHLQGFNTVGHQCQIAQQNVLQQHIFLCTIEGKWANRVFKHYCDKQQIPMTQLNRK